jgi:hypothetical protein
MSSDPTQYHRQDLKSDPSNVIEYDVYDQWRWMKKVWEGLKWYWWSYDVESDLEGFWDSFRLIILKVPNEGEKNERELIMVV